MEIPHTDLEAIGMTDRTKLPLNPARRREVWGNIKSTKLLRSFHQEIGATIKSPLMRTPAGCR